METNICRRNKHGYCKYGNNCHFRHEKQICIVSNCSVFSCEKRHPKLCSWFQQYGRCKFTSFCKFKHSNNDNIEELINRIHSNQNKLSEIEKSLAVIETEEEEIKKRMKVFEEQLETRFAELESKINLLFQLLEEKNEKITSLELILNESSVSFFNFL